MARKRKSEEDREPDAPAGQVFDSPFKDLKKIVLARPEVLAPAARPAPPKPRPLSAPPIAPVATGPDAETLFMQAVEGVRRMADGPARRIAGADGRTRAVPIMSEDAEVLAQLSDLVSGQGRFELTETEEYVEGARLGLDPRLVLRLRRGEFPVQAHLDMHGMIQTDAHEALGGFILKSATKGLRTVLIVHGRGRRSPGGMPVLKHATAQWLSHGEIGGHVLAFTTARPTDGGAGAMYVLLRRDRRRAPFDVLHGAKRRD